MKRFRNMVVIIFIHLRKVICSVISKIYFLVFQIVQPKTDRAPIHPIWLLVTYHPLCLVLLIFTQMIRMILHTAFSWTSYRLPSWVVVYLQETGIQTWKLFLDLLYRIFPIANHFIIHCRITPQHKWVTHKVWVRA